MTQKNKMQLQNKHDKDDRWIFERNPDTGIIRKRRPGDYGNEQIVNPAVNAVPNIDYEAAAPNLNYWLKLVKDTPNDMELGGKVREIINNKNK